MSTGWPAASMAEVYRQLCGPGAEFETVAAPGGKSGRIYRNAPDSLRHVFESSRRFAGRTFVVFEDERLDYDAHTRAVTTLAAALVREFHLASGSRVAIAMRNWPEWSVAFWAVVGVGAVAVPLNAWGSEAELRRAIAHCEPALVILDEERHIRLGRATAASLATAAIVVVRGENSAGGAVALETLLGTPARYPDLPGRDLPEASVSATDPATILYTSGTTGTPRAVRASHRNILSNLMSRRFSQARAALRRGQAWPGHSTPGVLLAPVPLFHVTGCHSYLVPTLASGDTMVTMHRWDPERALTLIEREQVTTVGGVPTMLVQLLDCDGFAPARMASVRAMVCGGAASGPALMERILKLLPGISTGNGYGMTETCSLISQITAEDHRHRPGSVGPLVPVCDARVVSEDGDDAPPGTTGELWVRGANVVTGYWKDPQVSAERFPGGWLRTGDLVRMDEEGFLYVEDRLKELVIRGGENISCAEVENALLGHPDVLESAVFGLPHPELGETVAAWVHVSERFTGDVETLRKTVAGALAAFKVPQQIWIQVDALPRNAAGKVLKRELVQRAMAGGTPQC